MSAAVDRATEKNQVEDPFIEQLKGLGWQHIEGTIFEPAHTERESFGEVLLKRRLRDALRRINLDAQGQPWLDDSRLDEAISKLDRISGMKLMEANREATDLLLNGTVVAGDPNRGHTREQTIQYIDFDPEHAERNDFLVVSQLRVDPPWASGNRDFIIPDLVLFVNGIPLVVVECKSPSITQPMDAAIEQLLTYSNQRDEGQRQEGAQHLFHYNQFLVGTFRYQAKVGTIGALGKHYLEWKDTSPVPMSQVAADLRVEKLKSQEMLIAGMLRKEHLLDLVRSFTLFTESAERTIKIVARYQQFRAVHEAIRRLRTGKTRAQDGALDRRGGIIWHTQGSGKSLTMVFLVRKMRTLPPLRPFKIVVVTDRRDLEKQLRNTAAISGETAERAESHPDLARKLRAPGPGLVFAMIQKAKDMDEDAEEPVGTRGEPMAQAAEVVPFVYDNTLADLNSSEAILLLIDEAHRSHGKSLHQRLMDALPNCAKIGFTGTPIFDAQKKRTVEIFGDFIDRYLLKQSEEDGATVPILYEGRTDDGEVREGKELDRRFEDLFRDRSEKEKKAIQRKYGTTENILEAKAIIADKAEDMLRHYVDNILPNGFKAQVAASTRRAAVRYQEALAAARDRLVARLEALSPALLSLREEALAAQDAETRFHVQAHRWLPTIRRLEFATVISSGGTTEDPGWKDWTDKGKIDANIERFRKPLMHEDPAKQDGLAFLCVKSMLLTGFDAPLEQVFYLDRSLRGPDLLQAIARVNRTAPKKTRGFVVDYFGVGQHLKEALGVYDKADAADAAGALRSINEDLPELQARHKAVLALFHEHKITDLGKVEDCVDLLRDEQRRASFFGLLRRFLDLFEIFRKQPAGGPYARDVRLLGHISKTAANVYQETQLNLAGMGEKVRQLIDDYVESKGINPRIPPVSILDPGFMDGLTRYTSTQTKASAAEHGLRSYIDGRFNQDPVHYQDLSDRLHAVLDRHRDDANARFEALEKVIEEVSKGRPADESGLEPIYAPFFRLLDREASVDAGGTLSEERRKQLSGVAVDMVDHIRQEVRAVDFWRSTVAQRILQAWIAKHLDDHDVVPFKRIDEVADRVVQLAHALHGTLIS